MKKSFIIALVLVVTVFSVTTYRTYAQAEDKTAPSDVEKVKAEPGDKKVTLSWDSATDNVGIDHYNIYYGTEPVNNKGGEYTNTLKTKGAETTYEMTGLENGVTYYFGLTAVDAAGHESEAYSYEQSATPGTSKTNNDGDDKLAPTVKSATATSDTQVKVMFSEAIKLPGTNPKDEFSIQEQESKSQLGIEKAEISDSDEATVILTTKPLEAGKSYLLTAGLNITDVNGNPVESGTSDTATFTGKGASETPKDPGTNSNDTTAPEIVSATSLSTLKVEAVFSEDIIFDNEQNFIIYQSNDDTKKVLVKKAEYGENKRVVVLETDAQTAGQEYVLSVNGVSDNAGNVIEGFQSTSFFITPEKNLSDLIPPEDVTNFMAKLKDNIVELSWTASANSQKDLADQILYQSTDKGKKYDQGKSLGPRAISYQLQGLKQNIEYTFKLTMRDFSGNESKGVVSQITIPGTGPGLGLIAVSALGLSGILTRRKRK